MANAIRIIIHLSNSLWLYDLLVRAIDNVSKHFNLSIQESRWIDGLALYALLFSN